MALLQLSVTRQKRWALAKLYVGSPQISDLEEQDQPLRWCLHKEHFPGPRSSGFCLAETPSRDTTQLAKVVLCVSVNSRPAMGKKTPNQYKHVVFFFLGASMSGVWLHQRRLIHLPKMPSKSRPPLLALAAITLLGDATLRASLAMKHWQGQSFPCKI